MKELKHELAIYRTEFKKLGKRSVPTDTAEVNDIREATVHYIKKRRIDPGTYEQPVTL